MRAFKKAPLMSPKNKVMSGNFALATNIHTKMSLTEVDLLKGLLLLDVLLGDGDFLVLGGANANGHYWTQFLAGEFERRRLVVLDANSGEKLWAKDANYRHRPIIIDNEIIAEPWSYDLYTGQQKMRTHPLTGEQTPWMFARPGHH